MKTAVHSIHSVKDLAFTFFPLERGEEALLLSGDNSAIGQCFLPVGLHTCM